MTTRTQRLRGLAAATGLALLVVGLPALLSVPLGWPLPRVSHTLAATWRMLLGQQVTDGALVSLLALALAVWLAWLACLVAFVEEVAAVARRRPARRLPVIGGTVQLVIAQLVAVVVLAVLSGSGTTSRSGPVAHRAPLADVVARSIAAEQTQLLEAAQQVEPQRRVYTVRPRDSLWAIAERELGDALRYGEIFDLNRGRQQRDGRVVRTPDKIWPGWELFLPVEAAPGAQPLGATSPLKPPPPTPPAPAPTPASSPSPAQPSSPAVASAPATPAPSTATSYAAQAHPRAPQRRGDVIVLPSGGLLALSFVSGMGSVLAVQRLRRRRGYRPAEASPSGLVPREEPVAKLALQLQRAAAGGWDDEEAEPTPSTTAAVAQPADCPRPPGVLTLGEMDGHAVDADIAALGGVGVVGEGAPDTLRALVLGAVMASQGDRPEWELLIGGTDAAAGMGEALIGHSGARPMARADEAVAAAEAALIHRARLAAATEAADLASLAEREPGEPLPVVVVVARADEINPARLGAILTEGSRFGISALLLGEWPQGVTIEVSASGQVGGVTAAPGGQSLCLEGGHAVQAPLGDALDCLSVLDVGCTPIATAPPPLEDDTSVPYPHAEPPPPWTASRAAAPDATGVVSSEDVSPIRVALLGGYRIEVGGIELTKGLRSSARELLAYLILHPRGVSAEALVELLWPDIDGDRGNHRLHTVVSNLRRTLSAAAGITESEIVDWRVGRYSPDHRLIDSDVWRFEAALAACSRAQADGERIEALMAATATYGGDLLDHTEYQWTEALRVDLRARAINALVALADLRETAGDLAAAAATVEAAVRIDPYAEDMHRRLMQLLVRMRRPDAARDRLRQLRARLEDIGVDPEPETVALAAELVRSGSARALAATPQEITRVRR